MPVVAVIPVKSFQFGKLRLASVLPAEHRGEIGARLAENTVGLAEEAGLLPVIVAGDAEVGEWALRGGIPVVEDPGYGLDGAARMGAGWASAAESQWLVVHADLPLLTLSDLQVLGTELDSGSTVLAPSSDGGTTAIGSSGRFDFTYGPGSFQRHLARLPGARIVTRLGLLHDLDSPADLESALAHPRGRWLADIMSGVRLIEPGPA